MVIWLALLLLLLLLLLISVGTVAIERVVVVHPLISLFRIALFVSDLYVLPTYYYVNK